MPSRRVTPLLAGQQGVSDLPGRGLACLPGRDAAACPRLAPAAGQMACEAAAAAAAAAGVAAVHAAAAAAAAARQRRWRCAAHHHHHHHHRCQTAPQTEPRDLHPCACRHAAGALLKQPVPGRKTAPSPQRRPAAWTGRGRPDAGADRHCPQRRPPAARSAVLTCGLSAASRPRPRATPR
eukprot:365019-Chlamydomonas_euryale.AAC.3